MKGAVMNALMLSIEAPAIFVDRVGDWRDQAVIAYQHRRPRAMIAMKTDIAGRLHMLIGRRIPEDSIYVDPERQIAVVVVDNVLFRWRNQALAVVQPCAECGLGQFESPPLREPADVGYALTAWQPLHPHCQPEDPVDWLEREDGAD
jgi:hypothetical protein